MRVVYTRAMHYSDSDMLRIMQLAWKLNVCQWQVVDLRNKEVVVQVLFLFDIYIIFRLRELAG